MFILNLIKQHAQRKAEKQRFANDARTNKEIEISNRYTGFSLGQIIDLISHEEQKLTDLSIFSLRRKPQRIFIAGLYRAKRRIAARTDLQHTSTIANAPVVLIQNKKAA